MDRFQTLHPDPAKAGVRIARWKYDAVKEAILAVIPEEGPGLPFKDLAGKVRSALSPEVCSRMGSVPWYTVTVKLDLEARGRVRRVEGAKPQRLVRVA